MNVEIVKLRALLELLSEQDVAEFEHESEGVRVHIVRSHAAPAGAFSFAAGVPAAGVAQSAGAAPPAPPAAVAGPEPTDVLDVTSPFVGTFYRSPSPEAP